MPSYVPPPYTDLHKRFLQLMMNRRMITYEDAYWLFCKVFLSKRMDEGVTDPATVINPTTREMEQVISTINSTIKKLNMEIRVALDESTCEKHYLFINTVDNVITRKFVKYTPVEMEFFKKILFEIVSSDDGSVSSTECLNFDSVTGNMTKSEIEALIDKLCKERWLYQKDGRICLSLLSIVELDPILTTDFKDYVSFCRLCKRVVMQGFRCESCGTALHMHCVQLYVQGQNRPCCPACHEERQDMIEAVSKLRVQPEIGDDSTPSTSSSSQTSVKGKGVGKRSKRY